MTGTVLWRASSNRHDWTDGLFLRRFLEVAEALGLIGSARWRKSGVKGADLPMSARSPRDLVEMLPDPQPGGPPVRYLEAGGDDPEWTVKLSIALRRGPELSAPNMAWLFFDAAWAAPAARSGELVEAFARVHDPTTTEYAFVHPYQHWLAFGDRHYADAVVSGSMFRGVFWANFLGPGHLDEFDVAKLRAVTAHDVRWTDEAGLLVVATGHLQDVEATAGEAELLRLTRLFRDALRAD